MAEYFAGGHLRFVNGEWRDDNGDAIEISRVRHGRWIHIGRYGEYECSVCHGIDADCSDYYSSHVVTEQDYCPYCGAKMDGGDGNSDMS